MRPSAQSSGVNPLVGDDDGGALGHARAPLGGPADAAAGAVMQAAFGLGRAAPAARALVLARGGGRGAGTAADRAEAAGDERVRRQVVGGHVGAQILPAPGGKRAHLDPVAVGLERHQARAGGGLVALAAGDRHRPAVEGAVERRDLPDDAAGVRVPAVERAIGVERREVGGRRAQVLHVGQAETVGKVALVGERLLEEHQRVDHQHRQVAVERRDHVEQDRRVGPERGDGGDVAGELRQRAGEDLLGPGFAVGEVERLGAGKGMALQVTFRPHGTGPPQDRAPP
jgi:hypothetical protein